MTEAPKTPEPTPDALAMTKEDADRALAKLIGDARAAGNRRFADRQLERLGVGLKK